MFIVVFQNLINRIEQSLFFLINLYQQMTNFTKQAYLLLSITELELCCNGALTCSSSCCYQTVSRVERKTGVSQMVVFPKT